MIIISIILAYFLYLFLFNIIHVYIFNLGPSFINSMRSKVYLLPSFLHICLPFTIFLCLEEVLIL